MSGASRIRAVFQRANTDGRAVLVPYFVAGQPSIERMPALVAEVVDAGADIVEIGVPFSDPLADGPVIRQATRRSLDAGVDVRACVEIVRDIRVLGVDAPIVLMGYVNPLLAYGIDRFCEDAAAAGVDGLIIPDMPLEEAAQLVQSTDDVGLGLTFLVTPLTDDQRIAQLAAASTGFLYAVATTGTTGARGELDPRTIELLDRARAVAAGTPVAVGFGISTPAHVQVLAPHADGVIVGSALVELVERAPDNVRDRVAELAVAARSARAGVS